MTGGAGDPLRRLAESLIADIEALQYGDRTLRLLMERTVSVLRALLVSSPTESSAECDTKRDCMCAKSESGTLVKGSDTLEDKALNVISGMIKAGVRERTTGTRRYCGMCDEWVKGTECPKCGADTDRPERCPECAAGNTPHTLAHENKP